MLWQLGKLAKESHCNEIEKTIIIYYMKIQKI